MRILKKVLGEGKIVLVPESIDDLWHLSKVIDVGDIVIGNTTRKFVSDGGDSERKNVRVHVRAEQVELHKYSNMLRVLGTIVAGHPEEYVQVGQHHTLEITPRFQFTIQKEKWYNHQLERLNDAVKDSKAPQLLIAVMDDEGCELATLHVYGFEPCGKISSGLHGKRVKLKSGAKEDYFAEVLSKLAELNSDKILIAGAGFVKDDFMDYVNDKKPELKRKIMLEQIGSSGKTGMQEVLKRDKIDEIMKNARIVQETKLMEKLLAEIGKGTGLATYGEKNVNDAIQYGAAEILLIAESSFRKNRDQTEKLMHKAEQINCKAVILSEENDAGEQLKHLGGIAAILRFKIE